MTNAPTLCEEFGRHSSKPVTHTFANHDLARVCLAIAVAMILLSSVSQRYLGHVMEHPDLDFYDYYFAAEVVRADARAPLYAGTLDGNPQLRSAPETAPLAHMAQQAGMEDTELYLYPPLFVDLLTPVTHLPLLRAAEAWRAFNLLLIFVSVWMLSRLLKLSTLTSGFGVLVAAAYSFWPIHEAVSLGQITLVLLGLWSAGMFAYAEELTFLSAFAFALATAFKVTPLLLVPLFVLWRDWRWLGAYCSSLLAMLTVMFWWNGAGNMLAFTHVLPAMGGILPSLQNKCIGSVLAWMYYGRVFTLVTVHQALSNPPGGLTRCIKLVDACFFGACLVLAWRRLRPGTSDDDRTAIIAIFALATLVIAPVSWRHGYTIALIPLVMLWAEAIRRRTRGLTVYLLTVTTIAVGSLVFDLAAQTPLPQPLKVLCASVWPISCALLCFVRLSDRQALRFSDTAPAARA